jgi:hypothetical protein
MPPAIVSRPGQRAGGAGAFSHQRGEIVLTRPSPRESRPKDSGAASWRRIEWRKLRFLRERVLVVTVHERTKDFVRFIRRRLTDHQMENRMYKTPSTHWLQDERNRTSSLHARVDHWDARTVHDAFGFGPRARRRRVRISHQNGGYDQTEQLRSPCDCRTGAQTRPDAAGRHEHLVAATCGGNRSARVKSPDDL